MRFLQDTDTCVHWLRGASRVRQQVADVTPAEICLSVVTVAELRYGASVSAQAAANHRAIDGLMAGFAVIMMIGATAISHNLILVTNNAAHFARLPQLKLSNWIRPGEPNAG